MNNEVKAVSFRITEEDIKKFRTFAEEQDMNQAEMFQCLVNNFEMAKAKGAISDRAKEIEVFQDTINNLMTMFLNSLAVNQTSEERIREVLSLELHTKDKTIADLQDREKEYKEKVSTYKAESIEYLKQANELSVLNDALEKEIDQKDDIINNLQDQVEMLKGQVNEYKAYKETYKELENRNVELEKDNAVLSHHNTDLETKIENLENMKLFYQSEVEKLKAEIKESYKEGKEKEKAHKAEIKALGTNHDKEIAALTKNYTTELEKAKVAYKEDIKNRIEFEKSKSQLELDKALNREQMLQSKFDALKEKYDALANKGEVKKK